MATAASGDLTKKSEHVDLEGLQELKAMLEDYESILKRLAARKPKPVPDDIFWEEAANSVGRLTYSPLVGCRSSPQTRKRLTRHTP
jgi:hypothetical protein